MNIKKLAIVFAIFTGLLMVTGFLESMFLSGVGIVDPVIGGIGIPVIGGAILTFGYWFLLRKRK